MSAMPRPLTKPRSARAAHLLKLRQAAGLSQNELAELVGERQSTIAFWETTDAPPRAEALPKLAKALGVTVEDILHVDGPPQKRPGPTGKAQRVLEEVSRLPRQQRDQIINVVSALLEQYKRSA